MTVNKQKTITITDDASKLEAVMNTVIDGLIIIDSNGTVHSYNRSAQRIFGYRPEEVIGYNVKKLMPEPYQSEHDGYLSNYKRTGERHIVCIGRSVEAKRKDGVIFPIELGVSEMTIAGEQMYVGTLRDISERKKAEEDLLQANSELEEFAYRTSHDLRSPLISSVGLIGLIKKAVENDQKEFALEGLDKVNTSLTALERLVESILTLSKAKNVEEEYTSINIEGLLNKIYEKLNHMDHFDRLHFEHDLQTPKIKTQPSRFTLILENLISNAIKYQDLKENSPHIKISTQSDNKAFTLSIQDNGLGVSKHDQKDLFKMFRRMHPKVSYGSGLGLYMMKKSADALGGDIAYKALDKGSEFSLTIPLKVVKP